MTVTPGYTEDRTVPARRLAVSATTTARYQDVASDAEGLLEVIEAADAEARLADEEGSCLQMVPDPLAGRTGSTIGGSGELDP
jgi:hypothetical protein